MDRAQKLRELATWYREYAERAGNPAIWEARLRTAEDLEKEAGNIESNRTVGHRTLHLETEV